MEITANEVSKRIYSLRGSQAMLDSDLAEIYGVEVRILKRAVRENIKRFPDDFMFELTKEEAENLRSRIWISSFKSPLEVETKPILRSQSVTSSLGSDSRPHGGLRFRT